MSIDQPKPYKPSEGEIQKVGDITDDETLNKGRVSNLEVARKMAKIENPYHEKTLGIIPPSERKIKKGEQLAEEERLDGLDIKGELPLEVLEAVKEHQNGRSHHGEWLIDRITKIEPLIGEDVTTYRVQGFIMVHKDLRQGYPYSKSMHTAPEAVTTGVLTIKTSGGKVISKDWQDGNNTKKDQ